MAGYSQEADAEYLKKTTQEYVLASSEKLTSPQVAGYDFNQGAFKRVLKAGVSVARSGLRGPLEVVPHHRRAA